MMLTEECAHSQIPCSPAERQKFIAAQEKAWMSLSWDRNRFTSDQAKTAITLLSAIAFSDYRDPIDLSHLSDDNSSSRQAGSSADAGSSQPDSQQQNDSGSGSGSGSRSASAGVSGDTFNNNSGGGGATTNSGGNNNNVSTSQQERKQSSSNKVRHKVGMKRPSESSGQNNNQTTTTNTGRTKHSGSGNSSGINEKPLKKVRRPTNRSSQIAIGTQVACYDKKDDGMWVLGRVERYFADTKEYEVLDCDGGEQTYRVTKDYLKVIPKNKPQTLDVNKPVLAVYPKTTVFYSARLVGRKGKYWAVEFDDEDYDTNKIKEVDGRFILQGCGRT